MNDTEQVRRPIFRPLARFLVAAGSGALLLLGLALFFSRYVFLIEIANNFRLQISIAILISAGVLFCFQWRLWAALQFVFALVVFYPVVDLKFGNQDDNGGQQVVTLMSYNVYGENRQTEPIVEQINAHGPDVLVVLEFEGPWQTALKSVQSYYPHRILEPRWHGFGIAMYSRFPIKNHEVRKIAEDITDTPLLIAEIEVDGRTVVVVAGHFLSPMSPQRMEIRNRQFAQTSSILREISQDGHPIVFVGDLNCVPWSPFAQDLIRENELRDSRVGFFYQGSWPTDNVLMRIPIDNAFVSEEIQVRNRTILSAASSDHYPLLLEFSIKP